MTQRLLDDRKVDVGFHQGDAEGVFQTVKMALVLREPSAFPNVSEDTMQLGAMNPTRLLGHKHELRGMIDFDTLIWPHSIL